MEGYSDQYGVLPEDLTAALERDRIAKESLCSSTDPKAYTKPEEHTFDKTNGGASISHYLPTRLGMKGTVVPRATRLGGSMGYNPHQRPGIVNIVNIDPEGTGATSFPVDLSAIDVDKLSALSESQDYRQVLEIEDVRSKASEAFEVMAKSAAARPKRPADGKKPKYPRIQPPAPEPRTPHHSVPKGTYVVPKATQGGTQVRRPTIIEEEPEFAPPSAAYQPEQVDVSIEIEGFGSIDVAYHHVVHDGDYLILGYDIRFPTNVRFMPQKSENPITVHTPTAVYQVYSLGIRFTVGDLDICVLLVNEEQSKE